MMADRWTTAERLMAYLWPERFPPGHRLHDPEHVYWQGDDDDRGECFEWSADTIEVVGMIAEAEYDREHPDDA